MTENESDGLMGNERGESAARVMPHEFTIAARTRLNLLWH